MSAAEVSRFAGVSPETAVSLATSWSPTLSTESESCRSAGELSRAASRSPTSSTRGELSASAERSVRPPSARPTAGLSDVAAPRARLIVVRARRPVIRSYAPGEKIQERGPSPSPNVQGVRLFILCFV